eukprot:1883047-Amphidinium_carterae.2
MGGFVWVLELWREGLQCFVRVVGCECVVRHYLESLGGMRAGDFARCSLLGCRSSEARRGWGQKKRDQLKCKHFDQDPEEEQQIVFYVGGKGGVALVSNDTESGASWTHHGSVVALGCSPCQSAKHG